METLTERESSYEHVEVTSDFYDLPNPYDQASESAQEQEPGVSQLQYIEGPDGFYVRDPETGEAVLSMPLIISGEQQQILQTVLVDGIASIDILTDFGTDDEDVWSLQAFSLSGETPDGRRIITLRAVTERRPKYQEEPEDQLDTADSLEEAAAISDARAAVEAAILGQDMPPSGLLEPAARGGSTAQSHSSDSTEPSSLPIERDTSFSPTAGISTTLALEPVASPDASSEPRNDNSPILSEVMPVYDSQRAVTAPAVVVPPTQQEASKPNTISQPTNDKLPEVHATELRDLPVEIPMESQADSESVIEPDPLPIFESLTEPEDTVPAPKVTRFELRPVKKEPPESPRAVKKREPTVLPPRQKASTDPARVGPLATMTAATKTKSIATPLRELTIFQQTEEQDITKPSEVHIKLKKDIKIVPQKAPKIMLDTVQTTPLERVAPAPETILVPSTITEEYTHEAPETLYAPRQPGRSTEHSSTLHTVSLESPSSRTRALHELNTPSWEQETNHQHLTSVISSQSITTDADDIVISFTLPKKPSKQTSKTRALRRLAA